MARRLVGRSEPCLDSLTNSKPVIPRPADDCRTGLGLLRSRWFMSVIDLYNQGPRL